MEEKEGGRKERGRAGTISTCLAPLVKRKAGALESWVEPFSARRCPFGEENRGRKQRWSAWEVVMVEERTQALCPPSRISTTSGRMTSKNSSINSSQRVLLPPTFLGTCSEGGWVIWPL